MLVIALLNTKYKPHCTGLDIPLSLHKQDSQHLFHQQANIFFSQAVNEFNTSSLVSWAAFLTGTSIITRLSLIHYCILPF